MMMMLMIILTWSRILLVYFVDELLVMWGNGSGSGDYLLSLVPPAGSPFQPVTPRAKVACDHVACDHRSSSL